MGTVLAFDFGEKRTGIVVGETAIGQAHPLTPWAEPPFLYSCATLAMRRSKKPCKK
jgi:RNase H-fold protein (predicted Holliday junction resolvase)